MRLYISAERDNTYFIDIIKKYCDGSQGKHSWIFLPEMPSQPGETLSRRIIRFITDSDLIFMDATPKRYQRTEAGGTTEERWLTNTGIVIEYAIAVALGKTDDLKVYCLESPSNLHQVLRETVVDPYPQNDETAFLSFIDAIVTTRERDSPKLLRQSRTKASFSSLYPEI
jgi:hypothetical protein